MAFNGDSWDEASPDNNDVANEIDDYNRDLRKGIRGRLAHEHVMPASQTGTNEGGFHKFVTFQAQTSAPSLVYGTSTQVGVLYVESTNNNLTFKDSAGSTYVVAYSGGGVQFFGGTGSIGDLPYITSGGGFAALAAATSGWVLTAQGTTAAPAYSALDTSSQIIAQSGTGQQMMRGANVAIGAGNTVQSYSFSGTFADTAYSLAISVHDIGDTGFSAVFQTLHVTQKTTTGFDVKNGYSQALTFDYIAIGTV